MNKLKTFAILVLNIVFCVSMYAQDWFVCMGSFKEKDNAKERSEYLLKENINTVIVEHKKSDNTILYRVLYSDSEKSLSDIHKKRDELLKNDAVKSLKLNDLWCCQAQVNIDDGKRYIVIKDSDTGKPVEEANVNIDKKWDVMTDKEGQAAIPDDVSDGEHSLVVSKDGEYVPTESTFVISKGKIESAPQISVPKAVDYNRIKIVLDWGELPEDLDAHVFCSKYHVYFSQMNLGNISLDIDDTDSYGPETITIKDLEADENYSFFVMDYTNSNKLECDKLSFSKAKVKVYVNNDLKETFEIKENQMGTVWHVFDVKNYEITKIDTVSYTRP